MKESLTKSWNRVLTNEDREFYTGIITCMFREVPDVMARKIGTANVQQAFIIDAVQHFGHKNTNILCVGAFEDTAYLYLDKRGFNVYGIDPAINFDLHRFLDTEHCDDYYSIIFSCSVIEHVKNDEEFLLDIIHLMNTGSVAILTCDFKNDYKKGDRVPFTSRRFYTKHDLGTRFLKILNDNNCHLVDKPQWDSQPYDFAWENIPYDFATLVFRKGVNNDKENLFMHTNT